MEKRLLALILEGICTQTRLMLLREMNKRCLISDDRLEKSILSLYEETITTLEIATKLLDEEDEKDDR